VLEDVGPNLRKLRRERDLTQGQVARFAGLRQQELSAIERGLQPKLALLDRLARALGVHPNELLRGASDHDSKTVEHFAAGRARRNSANRDKTAEA
jgi:transcriptional regulator with XRE-family HTH domain